MIHVSILSVFPQLHEALLQTSLIARAIKEQKVSVKTYSFASFCKPGERIDVPIAGHGTGMLIKPELVQRALESIENESGTSYRIFLTPQGDLLTQDLIKKLYKKFFVSKQLPQVKNIDRLDDSVSEHTEEKYQHILLICSRYEGMDARVEEGYADLLLSVGDYVLMGGESAANIFLEVFLRLIPGVVGKQSSVDHDSFEEGLLEHGQYGGPLEWEQKKIPAVVKSGDHGALRAWQKEESVKKTVLNRFDLIKKHGLEKKLREYALSQIPSHYLVLMHGDILTKQGTVGTTSVGSLNLHDICRVSCTYGIKKVFIVTPLEDQQAILKTFLEFWHGTSGLTYNAQRAQAIALLQPVRTFDEVLAAIKEFEQKDPLVVTTSAKEYPNAPSIGYDSQKDLWRLKKPILFVFGTGQGLAPHIMDQSSFILRPVFGLSNFNHLSVRAAIAIILDRWLGF